MIKKAVDVTFKKVPNSRSNFISSNGFEIEKYYGWDDHWEVCKIGDRRTKALFRHYKLNVVKEWVKTQ